MPNPDEYTTIFVSVEDAPGLYWPAPPPLTALLHRVAAKFLIFNYAKFEENFALTLPTPSARRFFNVERQCYFEMKMNREPYFSILSSIILWVLDIMYYVAMLWGWSSL